MTINNPQRPLNIWNIGNVDLIPLSYECARLAASPKATTMDMYSFRAKELRMKFSDIITNEILAAHERSRSFVWPIRSYDIFIPDELIKSMENEIRAHEFLGLQEIFLEQFGIEDFPLSELPEHIYGFLLESITTDKDGKICPTEKCKEEYYADFQRAISYIEKENPNRFKSIQKK